MQTLLKEMNKAQIDNPDLDKGAKQKYRDQYQKILLQGDVKCPPPDKSSRVKGQRGRLKRTQSRALLERLRDYQDDVLRLIDMGAVDTVLLSEKLEDEEIEEFELKAETQGSTVAVVSTDTREGEQLYRMGKIAAILRYPV